MIYPVINSLEQKMVALEHVVCKCLGSWVTSQEQKTFALEQRVATLEQKIEALSLDNGEEVKVPVVAIHNIKRRSNGRKN